VELGRIRGARRAGAVATAVAVAVLGLTVGAPSADAAASPRALTGAVPQWASGTPLATLTSSSTVDFVLQLAPRNQAALDRFAQAVNDPTSASYHHYLTAAQYAAAYGPTPASVSLVRSVLTTAGLTIDTVTDGGSYLAVHGDAGAVGTLFHTTFGTFDVGGVTLRSPLSTPTIPSAEVESEELPVVGAAGRTA